MVLEPVDVSVDLGGYRDDESLSMAEAGWMFRGRKDGPVVGRVIRRWSRNGRRVGRFVVTLPALRIGHEVRTMRPWIEAFKKTCERAAVADRLPLPKVRAKRSRAAAYRRAEERLTAAGVK